MKKNKYYADLNIIYPIFDYLVPKEIADDVRDLSKRRRALIKFLETNKGAKLIISKSVYIEWFQKLIEVNKENGESYSKFIKTKRYKWIIKRFSVVHKQVMSNKSIFEFDWNFNLFKAPMNQSWDHFHITMREQDYQFISFDQKFSGDKSDFIFLKK